MNCTWSWRKRTHKKHTVHVTQMETRSEKAALSFIVLNQCASSFWMTFSTLTYISTEITFVLGNEFAH